MTLGSFSPGMCGLGGHQIEVPGPRSNTRTGTRGRRDPYAVQKRERDADRGTLLDREDDDGRGGRDDQQEFAERLPVDRDDLAETDDPECDEQQDAAERRMGNMAQKRGAESQQCENDDRRDEAGEL